MLIYIFSCCQIKDEKKQKTKNKKKNIQPHLFSLLLTVYKKILAPYRLLYKPDIFLLTSSNKL